MALAFGTYCFGHTLCKVERDFSLSLFIFILKWYNLYKSLHKLLPMNSIFGQVVMGLCNDKEGNDMNTTYEKIDVKNSLHEAMNEVKKIREGQQPKRSWRDMIERVREDLDRSR